MALNYRISVNGKSYDVVVEELGTSAAPMPVAAPVPVAPAPVIEPAVSDSAHASPAAAPEPAPPAPAEEPKAVPEGGTRITCPMPGKIWKVYVREGDAVEEGQPVLVLEAMKMENEIFSPVKGKVAMINCREGDSANTGDVLVVID
ncbi:MAG: biotin/lipoyl-binding protein [Synergistaceae bacterium]|nr:biotin/lipoyl-binding protein [Synergistaceae bacterium]